MAWLHAAKMIADLRPLRGVTKRQLFGLENTMARSTAPRFSDPLSFQAVISTAVA
jgi:hypothetical protein